MSFDLLAEFAKPSPTAASQRPPSKPPASAPAGSGSAYQPGRNQFSFFDDLNELNHQPATSTAATPGSSSNNFGAFGSLASLAPAGQLTSAGPVPAAAATAFAQPPQPPPGPAQSSNNNDEDDDWGDFADAPTAQPSASLSSANPTQPQTVATDPWDSLRTATISTASFGKTPSKPALPAQLNSHPPPEDDDPFGLGLLPNQSTQTKKPSVPQSTSVSQLPEKRPSPPRDPNVLFDAEDLSEEDDFGDFEGTAAEEKPAAPSQHMEPARPAQPAPTTALNIDSLINDLELSGGLSAKAPTSKRQDWKSSTTAKLAARAQSRPESTPVSSTGTSPGPPAARKLQPAAQPIPSHDEDEWADFTETAAPKSTPSQPTLPAGITIPSTPNSPPDPLPNALPPTNIPPPFLLLNLFPVIFASAQASLFKPLGAQPPAVRSQILSHERTMRFLRSYLSIGVVAARIIAGRKLRWKRDAYLAQGMSIGPAGRAGGGGMKVVKLDRSEERREDSQVEEVVRAWREQVGRLRSLVVQVNSNTGGRLTGVPEVAETMAVRTAKEAEGGVPGTRACALCGLKRNERVVKVDVDVEDSFGEWWVEGVSMHRACRNFWEGNKEGLKGV